VNQHIYNCKWLQWMAHSIRRTT